MKTKSAALPVRPPLGAYDTGKRCREKMGDRSVIRSLATILTVAAAMLQRGRTRFCSFFELFQCLYICCAGRRPSDQAMCSCLMRIAGFCIKKARRAVRSGRRPILVRIVILCGSGAFRLLVPCRRDPGGMSGRRWPARFHRSGRRPIAPSDDKAIGHGSGQDGWRPHLRRS